MMSASLNQGPLIFVLHKNPLISNLLTSALKQVTLWRCRYWSSVRRMCFERRARNTEKCLAGVWESMAWWTEGQCNQGADRGRLEACWASTNAEAESFGVGCLLLVLCAVNTLLQAQQSHRTSSTTSVTLCPIINLGQAHTHTLMKSCVLRLEPLLFLYLLTRTPETEMDDFHFDFSAVLFVRKNGCCRKEGRSFPCVFFFFFF